MRFNLLDRIVELEPGKRITAVKGLTMSEEYLADHFPNFPVMPGVLMLEAMTQAAIWLIRITEDFEHGMVTLVEARNIKYGRFLEPGQMLTVKAEIVEDEDRLTRVKAQGLIADRVTVRAVLMMRRYNLSETNPLRADTDRLIRKHFCDLYPVVYPPRAAELSQSGA